MSLNEYADLWDGSSKEWGLVDLVGDKPGKQLLCYLIVSTQIQRALLIEDKSLYASILEKARAYGAKIVVASEMMPVVCA